MERNDSMTPICNFIYIVYSIKRKKKWQYLIAQPLVLYIIIGTRLAGVEEVVVGVDLGVAVVCGAAIFAVKRAREHVPLVEVEALVVCRVLGEPAVVAFLPRATPVTNER